MLEDAGLEPGGLDRQGLAVDVQPADARVEGTLDLDRDPGKAQERTATTAATREALERLSARRELGSVALSVDVDPQ